MIEIRAETSNDIPAVRNVHLQQFYPRVQEVQLVDILRREHQDLITLVELSDGHVVGRVLFSPITVSPTVAS